MYGLNCSASNKTYDVAILRREGEAPAEPGPPVEPRLGRSLALPFFDDQPRRGLSNRNHLSAMLRHRERRIASRVWERQFPMETASIQPPSDTRELASAPRVTHGSIWGAAAIFLLTVACHLPLLGSAPLAGTEGHRVFPALDMVRTGDWLLPRLFGQLYLIKPPLHDWLIAIAQILSNGHGNEFVWRLPSLIEGALLNVVLYLFGARWFGRIGGIVSGLCGLGLLCLWGQARTADVDSTNTFACSVAALCLVELSFGRPRRRWAWILAAGVALGATLLNKGPAGLPLIGGVLIWTIWSVPRGGASVQRFWSSTGFWSPLLIGLALFGAYAVAAKIALDRLHLPPDFSGLSEVGNNVFRSNLQRLLAMLRVPAELFAFTLPVSVALPLVFVPEFRSAIETSERDSVMPRGRLVRALAMSVLISWGICIVSGMINTRYGYVTVAPLCLLAGALATSVPYQVASAQGVFRAVTIGCVVVLLGGNVALLVIAWRGGIGHVAMPTTLVLAVVIAIITFQRLSSRPAFTAAWGLVVLLVLAAVPFAYQYRLDRFDRSGYSQAANLRNYVGGSDAPVLTGVVLHSLPELFWYAGLHPQVTPTFALQNPRQYPGGKWVVMNPEEYQRWSIFAGRRLSRVRQFVVHKDQIFVAWYDRNESSSASTEPDWRPSGHAAERK